MFYFDGEFNQDNFITLSVNNPALLYGATVFTTLRVYEKSLSHPLTNWQRHLHRLRESIISLDWQQPSWERITTEVEKILTFFPVIRITIFPDGKELILGRNLPEDLALKQEKGIKGFVCDEELIRPLPHHKTGNYLTPWLALEKAKKNHCQEAILRDSRHHWLETNTGNLWGYKEGIWFTPDVTEGILSGIARQIIIEEASFPVVINSWDKDFFLSLSAIALSNSVVEIIPFHQIQMGEEIFNYDANHEGYSLLKSIFAQ